MKAKNYWNDIKESSNNTNKSYDYSNPNNYWESVFIQNNKR